MKTTFTLIVILAFSSVYGQWIKCEIPEQNGSLAFAIDAYDQNHAAITFHKGESAVYYTEDGGDNWRAVLSIDETIIDLSFIDAAALALATDKGKLYKYDIPGGELKLCFEDSGVTEFINYVEFFNELEGVAMGDAVSGNVNPVILVTNNGGENWEYRSSGGIGGFSGDIWRRVDFVDKSTGFFYSSGLMPQRTYKTTDAGNSWIELTHEDPVQLLKFYDTEKGITVHIMNDENIINLTGDGGVNWTKINTGIENGFPNDLEYLPENPSFIRYTNYPGLYYSDDGGFTWHDEKISDTTLNARDIEFATGSHGWILCDNGVVFKTRNNGDVLAGVEENPLPNETNLLGNYPNPFNPSTIIYWKLAKPSSVSVILYDALGRKVADLLKGKEYNAGEHFFKLDAASFGLTSGIYFVVLNTDERIETLKIAYMK